MPLDADRSKPRNEDEARKLARLTRLFLSIRRQLDNPTPNMPRRPGRYPHQPGWDKIARKHGLSLPALRYWRQRYKRWGGVPRLVRRGRRFQDTGGFSRCREIVDWLAKHPRQVAAGLDQTYTTQQFTRFCQEEIPWLKGLTLHQRMARRVLRSTKVTLEKELGRKWVRSRRLKERPSDPPDHPAPAQDMSQSSSPVS